MLEHLFKNECVSLHINPTAFILFFSEPSTKTIVELYSTLQ
jgi:hypothetical protein